MLIFFKCDKYVFVEVHKSLKDNEKFVWIYYFSLLLNKYVFLKYKNKFSTPTRYFKSLNRAINTKNISDEAKFKAKNASFPYQKTNI